MWWRGTCQCVTHWSWCSPGDTLSNHPSSSSFPLLPALGRCQFAQQDTGNICCYQTSHFCPREPWLRGTGYVVVQNILLLTEQLWHLLSWSSSGGCTHVCAAPWGGFCAHVNFWHSPGTSFYSVSWKSSMLSWLILDPRATQPQLADCCNVFKYRSLHPRHCSPRWLHPIFAITCNNSPNMSCAKTFNRKQASKHKRSLLFWLFPNWRSPLLKLHVPFAKFLRGYGLVALPRHSCQRGNLSYDHACRGQTEQRFFLSMSLYSSSAGIPLQLLQKFRAREGLGRTCVMKWGSLHYITQPEYVTADLSLPA